MPGPSDSWYHERESVWLHRAVAAAEPDATRQALFQRGGLRLLLIVGGAGLAARVVGELLGASLA